MYKQQALPDNHVTILRTDLLDPVYLSIYLNSIVGKLQVDKHFKGSSGQIELYPNEIGQFLVWNAPEDIQQEIRSKVETSHQKREPICWSICVDPQIPNLQSHLQRLFYPSISY